KSHAITPARAMMSRLTVPMITVLFILGCVVCILCLIIWRKGMKKYYKHSYMLESFYILVANTL
ncbi:MAG: ABC-2 family transporter protein, partial [Bacteroidaceae bacterium]|nr:ABC-2 family transporter protein [Bacteroidaceae bacterium]